MSETDISNLKWMVRCNEDGVGFLGPSVRRLGRLPELEPLVQAGLAKVNDRSTWRERKEPWGYWITPAGRASLVTNGDRP